MEKGPLGYTWTGKAVQAVADVGSLPPADSDVLSGCSVGNGFVNHRTRVGIEGNCDELGIRDIGKGCRNALEAVARLWAMRHR